jgi:hypothetical protein
MNHYTHTTDQRKLLFLAQAKKIHGDKYDYSKVEYTNAKNKIEIICPTHGSFLQAPDAHRNGRGCPKCGIEKSATPGFDKRKTQEQFIEECNKIHNGKYDYSKVNYIGKVGKIVIICPEHGEFSQAPGNHLINKAGCPKCGIKKAHSHFLQTTQDFIRKARLVHGDTYDYSNSVYTGKEKPISITCKIHGTFNLIKANHHYLGHKVGCTKCTMSGTSKSEQEIFEFVKSLDPALEVINGSRAIIPPLELDVVIPSKKIAIEFNGLYWHSEQAGKDRNYHLNKTLACEKAGYQLIHVFEDEWDQNKEITKSRLKHILGYDIQQKYYARKLELKRVENLAAKEFFSKTHIQGSCQFGIAYGLYSEGDLVACMSFGANRFTKEREMELIRYSTAGNVVGGFSKLLKAFLREFPEVEVLTSYSDKRWSVGGVYYKNGFEHTGISQPGYFYVDPVTLTRINRVRCQKHKLPALLGDKFDGTLTEVQNMVNNGYVRIFDAGMDKWSYKVVKP